MASPSTTPLSGASSSLQKNSPRLGPQAFVSPPASPAIQPASSPIVLTRRRKSLRSPGPGAAAAIAQASEDDFSTIESAPLDQKPGVPGKTASGAAGGGTSTSSNATTSISSAPGKTTVQLPHYRPIHVNAHDSIFSRENIYSLGTSSVTSKKKDKSESAQQQSTATSTATETRTHKRTTSNSTLRDGESNASLHRTTSRSNNSNSSDEPPPTRFDGFRNLAMIVMIVGNVRLLVENYIKYGMLATFERVSGIPDHDIKVAILLTASMPLHLLISLLVERVAASWALSPHSVTPNAKKDKAGEEAKRSSSTSLTDKIRIRPKMKHLWRLFAAIHATNALLCLAITSYTVYFDIWHPVVGTICEIHAVVLCLKVASYALTNRDLRDATIYIRQQQLAPSSPSPQSITIPDLYSPQSYPTNLTLRNLVYFWWAPTLVYQPVYPRTPRIRWRFVIRQVAELVMCAVLMWFLVRQYAVPILENSLRRIAADAEKPILHNLVLMGERLMKLATVSIIVWLLGFFALFQSFLNLLAELLQFADRNFYEDWWNSGSLGTYWKLWNKPVSNYFRRHLYIPMLKRGFSTFQSSFVVFLVSALLHEVMVGIPTHNLLGFAFLSMMLQVPLILVTAPLERMRGPGSTIGNLVFWMAFFLGQPLGILVYYFAWNLKYNPGAVNS